MIMRRFSSVGGFIFIETLLIVMLLSTAAMLVMRGLSGAQKINRDMAVKTIGLHLANGKIAECEYAAAQGAMTSSTSTATFNNVLGDPNSDKAEGMTAVFSIKATVNGNHVLVTVTPTVNGIERNDLKVSAEKDIIAK